MKIAVNTRLLLKNKLEGIGWFTYETLSRMTVQHPEHEFYFIFDRPYDSSFIFSKNVTPIVAGPPSRHPLLWYIWFNFSLARVLNRLKPQLFLSPEGYICLNTNIKTINVMHDIAYEHFPETIPFLVKTYYKYYFPKFAARADRIATVSQFSKDDLVKTYHIEPEKIKIVYNGCNESFQAIDEDARIATRAKWSAGIPYYIYIGGINPRKNIKNLLLAFEKFKSDTGSAVKLLLVGKKGFGSEELDKILKGLNSKNDIHFLGRVEDIIDVNHLISSSMAMTYVPVFEGFGIPCLEAMRCGTVVITSNTSSLPEVCGEAAVYVDPFSIDSIAAGMKNIANDPVLREDLIKKGLAQSQKFSWQRTADLLWKVMEDCINE